MLLHDLGLPTWAVSPDFSHHRQRESNYQNSDTTAMEYTNDEAAFSTSEEPLDGEERPQSAEDAIQMEWHRRYIEQQRRMMCPGCGEGEGLF